MLSRGGIKTLINVIDRAVSPKSAPNIYRLSSKDILIKLMEIISSFYHDEDRVEKYIQEAVYLKAEPYSVIDDLYVWCIDIACDYRYSGYLL